MRFEHFFSKRFLPTRKAEGSFSASLTKIAMTSVALGVTVMVMSVAILNGFRSNIKEKVIGFGSHLTISSYRLGNINDIDPITIDTSLLETIKGVNHIRHVQTFADKGAMVKTDKEIHGVVFRGLDHNYDSTFFLKSLVEGRLPHFDSTASNEVIISNTIASKLELSLGDKVRTYFLQDNSYRARAFTICGIYQTDLALIDNMFVVGDIMQVQKLNGWSRNQAEGLEVLIDDFNNINLVDRHISEVLPYEYRCTNIINQNPALFSWLALLGANINLILIIMACVCVIAVISALLIMIFEKSRTIGVLKTLGTTNRVIRRIFIYKALRLTTIGVVIGDAIALTLCIIQKSFSIVRLDPTAYSMSEVPIEINLWTILIISIATIIICLVAMLIPTMAISRISPAETVRREK